MKTPLPRPSWLALLSAGAAFALSPLAAQAPDAEAPLVDDHGMLDYTYDAERNLWVVGTDGPPQRLAFHPLNVTPTVTHGPAGDVPDFADEADSAPADDSEATGETAAEASAADRS